MTNMSNDAGRNELVESAEMLMREGRNDFADLTAAFNKLVDDGGDPARDR